MCRWAAYIGKPVFLEELVTRPDHSLIAQSRHAAECKTETNGDGVGLAWYGAHAEPGLYRDVHPAWSDENLQSLCRQVQSGAFLAHVRASTGTATSRSNCHPFVVRDWSFCHNGQIGGFERFRRRADMAIPDALYAHRHGTTDSEVLFLLALAYGLEEAPLEAVARAATRLQQMSEEFGTAPHLRASAVFTNGSTLYAVRLSSDRVAPSVYYRRHRETGGWIVVSEPLEQNEPGWMKLPAGHLAEFSQETGPRLMRVEAGRGAPRAVLTRAPRSEFAHPRQLFRSWCAGLSGLEICAHQGQTQRK